MQREAILGIWGSFDFNKRAWARVVQFVQGAGVLLVAHLEAGGLYVKEDALY